MRQTVSTGHNQSPPYTERHPVEKFYSPAELCEVIPGMTVQLLNQMRFRGDSIPYIRVSPRKIVYKASSVEAYLAAREQTSTRENVSA